MVDELHHGTSTMVPWYINRTCHTFSSSTIRELHDSSLMPVSMSPFVKSRSTTVRSSLL